MNPTFNKLRVSNINRETEDCVSIAFSVPENLQESYTYKPGQYLTLKQIIDGEELRRSYSICSGLNDGELRVAVKKIPNGRFSTFANEQLTEGTEVEVMTPMGNFTTDITASTAKSFVFYAGGSGITPILSLIKTILETAPKSNVVLFYGNRGFDSIIFREEFENLKNKYMNSFRLIHIFSIESIGNKLQKGLMDKTKVGELHAAFLTNEDIDEVFVCGPEPMIHAVKDTYKELGFADEKVHFELFTSPSSKPKETEKKAEKVEQINANVTIVLDGEETLIELDSQGESILEAGYKAGADLPFACKGGVCCTCKAKVLEGTAVMDVNYALEKDEVEAGYILTCQAHPTSDKLVVSFDD